MLSTACFLKSVSSSVVLTSILVSIRAPALCSSTIENKIFSFKKRNFNRTDDFFFLCWNSSNDDNQIDVDDDDT